MCLWPAINLILDRVALRPLLADALQFPWLEGSGKIYLELAGQGLTERQIVESLNGKIEMASADGAIIGLDVGKIVRDLQRGAAAEPDTVARREDALQRTGRQPSPSPTGSPETRTCGSSARICS